MKTHFAITTAFHNLGRRKLRTTLTVFAVVIGTTLLASMVSLGVGLQRMVISALKSAGELTDINVYAKDEKANLGPESIAQIEEIPGVARVDPLMTLVAEEVSLADFTKKGKGVLVSAVPAGVADAFTLVAGKGFSSGDTNVVVAGENFIQEFSLDYPESFLGKTLSLRFGQKEIETRIIGVARAENVWSYGIFVPLALASQVKKQGSYDSLRVKAESVQKVAGISKEIKGMGLTAVTLDSLVSKITKYFRILELALGSVGIIILAVSSLGIINTMIMAILERTREIGVMRAVGASRGDIIKIFSFEAGAIGFVGGVLGVILGWLLTFGLGSLVNRYLASQEMVSTQIDLFVMPWWLVLGLVTFATMVGLFSGLYPALRAARLGPVEALRHE